MAQASIAVTAGTGPPVDFRTVGATPYYRQVIALGDPSTDTGTAPVDATYGVGADIKRVVADPFGANADAAVHDATGSINAHLRGIAKALGTNADATVAAGFAGSIDALLRTISRDLVGNVIIGSMPALNSGTNFIGRVAAGLATDVIYYNTTALTPKFATIAVSSSGNNTILAAVTSKKIRVLAAQLISNGTVNAKWQTGAGGTDLTGLAYLVANAGYVLPFNPSGWFETASNTLLNLNLSAGVAVGGCLTYVEI